MSLGFHHSILKTTCTFSHLCIGIYVHLVIALQTVYCLISVSGSRKECVVAQNLLHILLKSLHYFQFLPFYPPTIFVIFPAPFIACCFSVLLLPIKAVSWYVSSPSFNPSPLFPSYPPSSWKVTSGWASIPKALISQSQNCQD